MTRLRGREITFFPGRIIKDRKGFKITVPAEHLQYGLLELEKDYVVSIEAKNPEDEEE